MAKKSHYSFQKFQREKMKQKKKQDKQLKKQEAKDRKAAETENGPVVDPDIADIIPGPQPPQEPEE